MSFHQLLAEGESVPLEGFDFSWFAERASEERPPWGYASLLARRAGEVGTMCDLETGGGEVLAWSLGEAGHRPETVAATEGYAPNAAVAGRRLAPFGVGLVRAADGDLPFKGDAFELVSSRHPVEVAWEEVARVLRPGGRFLSQMVGAASNRELYEFLMGPQQPGDARSPERAVAEARRCGLEVVDLRQATLEVRFYDVGAVVHFLSKVPWTVPGFTVEGYLDRLAELHDHLARNGRFVSHSTRFLLEATK